jgi:hypothetical protein
MLDNQATDTELRRALTERCTLNGAELDERLAEIDELTRWWVVDRRQDGDDLVLTFDPAPAAEVRDLVRRERECCGHLEFAMEETDERIRVVIRLHADGDPETGDPRKSPSACGCAICGD